MIAKKRLPDGPRTGPKSKQKEAGSLGILFLGQQRPAALYRFIAWSFLFVVDDYEAPKRSAWEIPEASFLENTL